MDKTRLAGEMVGSVALVAETIRKSGENVCMI
jgi:hypothetical protein